MLDATLTHQVNMATVGDSTDPEGTKRPNEPVQAHGGTHFVPLPHLDRAPVVICSAPRNALMLFELYFTDNVWDLLVMNTNKNAHMKRKTRAARGGKGNDYGGAKARRWYNTSVSEMRVYVALLIYMGLHPENQVKVYWKPPTDRLSPNHDLVRAAMSLNRFERMQRFIHISDPNVNGPAHTKVLLSARTIIVAAIDTYVIG
jgi:hypothetical protein